MYVSMAEMSAPKCPLAQMSVVEMSVAEMSVVEMSDGNVHGRNVLGRFIHPYTTLLYSKTGVYRGIHYFLIFALKHILWELIRAASLRRFHGSNVYPQFCFEQKYENSQKII